MKTTVTMRIEPKEFLLLKKEAEKENTSVSEIIRRKINNSISADFIAEGLARIEKKIDDLGKG
jgi:hypothetical protein